MRLDARNKRWTDEKTARMACLFEDAGFDREAESIIRDGKKEGLSDGEVRDAIGRKMGYILADVHRSMEEAGGPLGQAMLTDPWDCRFDWWVIADAYLEAYGESRSKGPSTRNGPAGKASNNSRPKSGARTAAGRRRP